MVKKYQVQDYYFNLAKKEGFRARSVYKLKEILEKFKIKLNKNKFVLDIGSYPGSWSQYLSKNSQSKIIACDLQNMEKIDGVFFMQTDVRSENFLDYLKKQNISKFDLIVSDIAPKTTGVFDVDQYASVELNLEVLEIVKKYLNNQGVAIFKIFRGEDFNDFWFEAKNFFREIKTYKPKACRDRSYEIYCIGKK